MKIVNPFNRTQDNIESAAYACACVCNAVANNYGTGQWRSIIPGGSKCGCACDTSGSANHNKNHMQAYRVGNA